MWPRTDPNLVQAQVWARRTFFQTSCKRNLPAPVTLLPPSHTPTPPPPRRAAVRPPRCTQMAGPDGLPFILAPITFSWGGVVWEGVSETARGVVGWGKGARTFAMSPIAASYSGVLGARHLSPCSDLCIGREFGAARGGHPVGRAYHSMTLSHRIHNVLSVYISALSLNCMS